MSAAVAEVNTCGVNAIELTLLPDADALSVRLWNCALNVAVPTSPTSRLPAFRLPSLTWKVIELLMLSAPVAVAVRYSSPISPEPNAFAPAWLNAAPGGTCDRKSTKSRRAG